ncbi:MAG: ABC transporter ATP-binding protein [Candidatus Thorarchaeota archaeon]
MVEIKLMDITKTFGEVVAVDDVTIDIDEGELFTLLGPSGCGKTTLLRVVAGFYFPDNGRVMFDDQDITSLPPYKRDTGMVFQNYAIWPHMKIFDNVAFGLRIRKLPAKEIKSRVDEVLDMVRLGGFGDRTPFQLSGGQQQRVALARALVINPKVLLLDEPLSNLDAKLRLEMRHELISIQKQFGTTTIYVTHDQEEALSISDRIAVIELGKLMQVGSPREIYEEPQNLFVADFIGSCTFFNGKIVSANGSKLVMSTPWGLELHGQSPKKEAVFEKGDKVFAAIRPEDFKVQQPSTDANMIPGKVKSVVFTGRYNDVRADVGATNLIQAEVDASAVLRRDDELTLYIKHSDTIILPAKGDHFSAHIEGLISGASAAL